MYFLTYLIYVNYFTNEIYDCFRTQLTTPLVYCIHIFLCVLILVTDLVGKKFN
jgi:hypothetical protein